jgi:hypothetical protein
MFFWVFPRRQIVVGRRFGTLCQFHLQRLDVVRGSTTWKPLLHTLKEKRDKHTIHNNPNATWHASFYTSPSTPTHLPWTAHYLMPPLPHWSGQLQLEPRQGYKIPCFLSHLILYIQPLKMELTQGPETSANYNLTPGKYPKEHIQYSNHGESLKSRTFYAIQQFFILLLD